jgi:DNA primase
MFEKVVSACQSILASPLGEEGKQYLDGRLKKEAQEKFRFGYFPDKSNLETLFSYVDEMELLDDSLLYPSYEGAEGEFYSPLVEHNLVLPYRDVYGNVIALVGRTLLSEDKRQEKDIPKYKNTSFKKSQHLFGLFESKASIRQKKYVYIVEGQFDCIQAHACGIQNIVAVGSSNLSFEQLVLLLRYTNDIRLLFDNDEAGDTGRESAMSKYGKYCNIQNNYVPVGFKDFDEYLKEMNGLGIKEIEAALAQKR